MKRLVALGALFGFLLIAGSAQAQDPCDVNPDTPGCDAPLFEAVPATPDICPAGGWVFVFLGDSFPVCNGLPGTPGAPGAPGAAAPPPAASVIQQVINSPVIAPIQPAGCLSRREFDVTIPQRFRWGTRVQVLVGGRKQYDGSVPSVLVRANHRIRVALQGRPCGVYAVIVTKKGKRPWFRLYTAGPNGNMTGINLAMARAASRPSGMYYDDPNCHNPGDEGIPDHLPPKIHTFFVWGQIRALKFLESQLNQGALIFCAPEDAIYWDNLRIENARNARVTWHVIVHKGDFTIDYMSGCRIATRFRRPSITNPQPTGTQMRCRQWFASKF